MKQGITYKQPFRNSITFRTIFYSILMLFSATCFIVCCFNINYFTFSWKFLVAYISLFVLIVLLLFLGVSLIFRSNYVVIYDDRIVCLNSFFSSLAKTYHFNKYQNYTVLIYTKSPYAHPMGVYPMICFCAPGKKLWKMKDYQFIASVSVQDCIQIAQLLLDKGINVKLYKN